MAKTIQMKADLRTDSGSAPVRRLRRKGLLPGVLCGEGGEARSLQLDRHTFDMMMRQHASDNLVIDLAIAEEPSAKVLLREVQRDPLTDEALHVDFVRISMTRKMRVRVPVELVGTPAGIQEGGILEHLLRDLEVECLPGDLVDKIQVDVSALKIGQAVLISQIQVPPKLTVLTGGSVAVAAVSAIKVEEEAAPAEEAAAEPEVLTEKKAGEGEEAEAAEGAAPKKAEKAEKPEKAEKKAEKKEKK
jgi:large subunit ribosomal protein L25